jgi:hypothetical protein
MRLLENAFVVEEIVVIDCVCDKETFDTSEKV